MMEIDIISFTDEQFAALTEEQLLEVENEEKSVDGRSGRRKTKREISPSESRSIPLRNLDGNLRFVGRELRTGSGVAEGRALVLSALRFKTARRNLRTL